jgi:hypothetical protein
MKSKRSAEFGMVLGGLLAFSSPAFAQQQVIGEVIATIDGDAFEWRTYGPDQSGTDYNTSLNTQFGMPDVSVMGFPPGEITMRGIVQLSFMLMPDSLDMLDQEVIFAPEGMSRMWMSLEGEDLITIEEFDATEPTGAVSGRFSGRVCQKESMLAEPDPETCKQIEGTFNTRLPHISF